MQNYINLKKLEQKNEISLSKKIKDWYIQGVRIQKVYLEDWDEIKSIFSTYGLNLSELGPILTLNELKNVRLAKQMTENLVYNKNIRDMIDLKMEREIKGKIFLVMLRILPVFCNKIGIAYFEKWIDQTDSKLNQLFELEGTLKETEEDIERILEDVIFLSKKVK